MNVKQLIKKLSEIEDQTVEVVASIDGVLLNVLDVEVSMRHLDGFVVCATSVDWIKANLSSIAFKEFMSTHRLCIKLSVR